jgi:hypothetical protein
VRQTGAVALYRDLGFAEIGPYADVPDTLREWLRFFRLDL